MYACGAGGGSAHELCGDQIRVVGVKGSGGCDGGGEFNVAITVFGDTLVHLPMFARHFPPKSSHFFTIAFVFRHTNARKCIKCFFRK